MLPDRIYWKAFFFLNYFWIKSKIFQFNWLYWVDDSSWWLLFSEQFFYGAAYEMSSKGSMKKKISFVFFWKAFSLENSRRTFHGVSHWNWVMNSSWKLFLLIFHLFKISSIFFLEFIRLQRELHIFTFLNDWVAIRKHIFKQKKKMAHAAD